MAQTIYQSYLSGEDQKYSQLSEDSLRGIAEQRAKEVLAGQKENQEQQLASQQNPSIQRGLESVMNATNPMSLSPDQLTAVKAMNQRNNARYLFDIAKNARDVGNVADSQKYTQFAKQFNKNAASLDRDALLTRREVLADDSLLLKNVHDQQSLNNVVSLADLRGRPMTELLQMTDDGLYSGKTKNYIESRLGQIGQEKDWINTNVQVLDDETRYYDRLADDKRSSAFDAVQRRKDSIAQQNLVKEEKKRASEEAKLQRDYLKTVPQSFQDLIKKQKAAMRNVLSDKRIQDLKRVNPELAEEERKRKDEISDPIKYAASLGYDLDVDKQTVQSLSDKSRDVIKALPSSDILLNEWKQAKSKVPTEEELDLMKLHKDPTYGVEKAKAEQIETIDKFVKSKYGVAITPEDMKNPMEREIYTDDTGQVITPKALLDTAAKHRMSVDQVLLQLGVPWADREQILSKYPDLK